MWEVFHELLLNVKKYLVPFLLIKQRIKMRNELNEKIKMRIFTGLLNRHLNVYHSIRCVLLIATHTWLINGILFSQDGLVRVVLVMEASTYTECPSFLFLFISSLSEVTIAECQQKNFPTCCFIDFDLYLKTKAASSLDTAPIW